jgi:hypothetical protein
MVSFEINARSVDRSGFVVNTTSDAPSMVRKLGAGPGGGVGAAIASVKSSTSAAGAGG